MDVVVCLLKAWCWGVRSSTACAKRREIIWAPLLQLQPTMPIPMKARKSNHRFSETINFMLQMLVCFSINFVQVRCI